MQTELIQAYSSGSNYSGFPLRSCEVAPQRSDAFAERRGSVRSVKTFMPACIEAEGQASIALLRDFSAQGAGFESDRGFRIGQDLKYRWANEPFREARVIWVKGGRYGVVNSKRSELSFLTSDKYRSVRVDFSAPAKLFIGERRLEGEIINFAQKGFCILLDADIHNGSLATIKVGRRFFENVTARWKEGNRVGFALPSPLPIPEMSKLVAGY